MLCYFHHCWINIKWNIYLIIKPLGITRDYLGLTILKDSALHVPPVLWNSLRAVDTHFLQKIRRHKKPHGRQDARLMSCNQYKLAPAKDKSNTQEKNIYYDYQKIQVQHKLEEVTRLLFTERPVRQLELHKNPWSCQYPLRHHGDGCRPAQLDKPSSTKQTWTYIYRLSS